ncbi:coiled-coil domain-containing protein 89 [Xyrichtys novacula]|nr:coiled-coil domain-containing protein 89 [Xyrichtys novacula]
MMATPQRKAGNLLKTEGDSTEHLDDFQRTLGKLRSLSAEDSTETGMLRSRLDEQSSLISMLKHRADELLLRCEALQKINQELECCMKDCQTELENKRKKADLTEKRFMDLSSNNQAIITFMDEYKKQNGLLKQENKKLQAENDTLFSQQLQDKDTLVQKLMQDIKLLTEKHTNKENEYREKLAECQSNLQEQASQHQAKEAMLLAQLHDAQQQQRDTADQCEDLKLKLQKTEEELTQREIQMKESITSLNKEKDKLLNLSMERGKLIQEKQEEIHQLGLKLKEEKKTRAKAEDR